MAVVGEASVVVRAITSGFKKDVQGASRGIGGIGEGAGRDYGNGINRGFSQSIGGFTERNLDIFEVSRRQFRRLSIATNFLVPAITGVVGIIGSLVTGLGILVGAAGNAAKALGVGLLGAITAVAQAAVTLSVAFKGFDKAMEAAKGGSNGAANAARAEAAALTRLKDARLNLKRIIEEEAPEALAQARERAADAADAAAAAVRSQERAQRTYVDAQKDSLDAQADLNDAREDAKEKLQQLRFELEGAAIGEKRARLEFEKARDSLQAVQDLPPNSRARQEAELAFAQAELNLRKAIDNNSDLKKEEEAATRAGIEGSDGVVKAKERIADAAQAEKDAAINLALAVKAAAKAQKEANQAAADASAGGRVERELQRRIEAARQQVRDAEQAAVAAKSAAAGAAKDPFAFTDAQLRFAQFLKELAPAFFALREAAGIDLFPRLEKALGNIVTGLFPTLEGLLRGTGKTIGDIAVNFSEVVTEGENVSRLESVWKTNDELLKNLGTAGGNLYEALLLILDAAEPVITAFGEWAASSSAEFLADLTGQGDGLRESFEKNLDTFSKFKSIIDNVFGTFGNLGTIINEEGGAADSLLGYLEDITGEWEKFTGSDEGKEYLRDFFEGSGDNFQELLTLVGLIAKGFLELGASDGVGDLLRSLQDVTRIFNDLGQDVEAQGALTALGDAAVAFSEVFVSLTESGAITVFFETLTLIFTTLNDIFSNETVQAVLRFIAPIIAVGVALGFGFLRPLSFVVKAFRGFLRFVGRGFSKISLFFQAFKKGPNGVKEASTTIGKFGQKIAFALRSGLDSIRLWFMEIGPKIANFFKGLAGRVGDLFKTLGRLIGQAFGAIGRFFSGLGPKLLGVFKNVGAGIGRFFTGLITKASGVFQAIGKFASNLGTRMLTVFRNIGAGIGRFFTTLGTKALGALGNIGRFFAGLGGKLLGVFGRLGGIILRAITAIPGQILGFLARLGPIILQGLLRLGPIILRAVGVAIGGIPGLIIAALVTIIFLVIKYWDEIWAFLQSVGSKIVEWGSAFWNWLGDGFAVVWEFLQEMWEKLVEFVFSIPGRLAEGAGKLWTWIQDAWNDYWAFQQERFAELLDFFKNLPGKLADLASGLWDWLKDTFKDALNWVIDRWNNFELDVRVPTNSFTEAIGLAGKGFTIKTPNIPRLAMGGVVSPTGGGTLAMIAEAGRAERVEPLDSSGLSKRDRAMISMLSGGGGATINVYPSPGMDERELANMVSRKLASQMRRGSV